MSIVQRGHRKDGALQRSDITLVAGFSKQTVVLLGLGGRR